MSLKAVLFDLDGTLLPMDQDVFVKTYFGYIAKDLAQYGYQPNQLIDAIWQGTIEMIKNKGEKSNEAVFWDKFAQIFGEEAKKDEPKFAKFYVEHFDKVKQSCGFNEKSKIVIDQLKQRGLRLALATNPIFPSIATEKRIAWAGLKEEDFELFTTYENCRYSKPNLKYYQDVLDKMGISAQDCLMVGNDVDDDMVAQKLGMKVFLVVDCLINKSNQDLSQFPKGNLDDLLQYVKNI